jgi:hypothetical protein
MLAKFDGKCANCGKPYSAGQSIRWNKFAKRGQRGTHRDCSQQSAQSTPARSTENIKLTSFDSPAAFAAGIEAFRAAGNWWKHDNAGWTGETIEQSLKLARTGDETLVPAAQKLIDSLRVDVPDAVRPLYVPAPYGAYPIVPEALAGYPLSMRARVRVEDDRAPIRIYADLTTSAGVDVETIAKRGTAILALAMMLSETRALDLFVLTPLNNFGGISAAIVRINAQPLELATACYAFTSAGFARNMGYGWAREGHSVPDQSTNWGFGIHPDGDNAGRYARLMRAALKLEAADLFVPPVYMGDPIVNDPARWITQRLAELGKIDETETA